MPVIKSAKKKLRQDIKREKQNDGFRNLLKNSIAKARKTPTPKNVSEAFRTIDKMAKRRILHKNKAARLKSSLSKLIKSAVKTKTSAKSPVKKAKKK
ncbi:MAG TPA: 30S ribosomal protein S20 [Patescibacteria group bacterium]|nr:30S ribosomal protein S20 [Patescibacteria group bacterium]